jgi:glycosyltransferase involved in cell wall biosynthesis
LVSAQVCWLRNRFLPGAKIISETEQNIDKTLPFPFEQFRSYVLRHADFAIGRSTAAVEVLRRKGFRGSAQVVPNAVDPDLFRPMDCAKCREELGVEGFVAGYVGRVVPEKGIEDLLDALVSCPAQVNLLVVGQVSQGDIWQAHVRARGLATRVRFVGACPSSELPRIMNAMDTLVVPSRTTASWKEQFGRVVIEAHACGVPVVGSDSGAIPEVVGEGGLIVPERDSDALANAIMRLVAAPNWAREMGRLGRQQVEAQYTWKSVGLRMRDVYFKTVDPQPESAPVLV